MIDILQSALTTLAIWIGGWVVGILIGRHEKRKQDK